MNNTVGNKIEEYEEEIATMKIMIYSLKQGIDDMLKAFGARKTVKTEKWEADCRKVAKECIKKEKGNEVQE